MYQCGTRPCETSGVRGGEPPTNLPARTLGQPRHCLIQHLLLPGVALWPCDPRISYKMAAVDRTPGNEPEETRRVCRIPEILEQQE